MRRPPDLAERDLEEEPGVDQARIRSGRPGGERFADRARDHDPAARDNLDRRLAPSDELHPHHLPGAGLCPESLVGRNRDGPAIDGFDPFTWLVNPDVRSEFASDVP